MTDGENGYNFKSGEETTTELYRAGECLYAKKRNGVANAVLNFILIAFIAVVAIELVFNCFYTGIYVVNISMQPNFNGAVRESEPGGDFIYVNKWSQPQYGDVVVVYRDFTLENGTRESGNIIKRVVALGGDTVKIEGGVLYRNGEPVDESAYIFPEYNLPLLNNYDEHVVKENCMFLLGDNRNKSTDSREYGDFELSALVGVVPKWSIATKGISTAIYTFFNFTIFGKY